MICPVAHESGAGATMHLQLVAHDRRAWPASLHGIYGSCRGARSSARMWCLRVSCCCLCGATC